MSFIVGSIVIGAGASIAGAAIGAKGAKSAANTAAAGSQAEIDYLRESRDLAREDQAPYREAGSTALDALMSMTGLKGTGQSEAPVGPRQIRPRQAMAGRKALDAGMDYRGSAYSSGGSEIYSRNQGGPLYNINELGPENVFDNGAVTRSSMPRTVPPSPTGYVGRAAGGPLDQTGPEYGWGGPQRIPAGAPPPKGGADFVNPSIPDKGGAANGGQGAYQPPQENPGGVEGGYNFQTDPGYNFRFNEGMRGLERGAGAAGGLLSGGFGRKAIRYGQDYASNEYTNVYNRIANIAGLGQVSAQSSGGYAMNAGAGMGTAAAQGAQASAYGQQASGNAWANAANQIGQLPWGKVFNKPTDYPGVPA